jgi:hypothetical protein
VLEVGGGARPSLSAIGKAVSAGVEEGPPTGFPGAAGFAPVFPVLATEVTGIAGQPQGSGS